MSFGKRVFANDDPPQSPPLVGRENVGHFKWGYFYVTSHSEGELRVEIFQQNTVQSKLLMVLHRDQPNIEPISGLNH